VKILVVGGGSIGCRHLKNLQRLGIEALAAVEPDRARGAALSAEIGVPVFDALAPGLDWQPQAVVIATPSHLHVPQALEAARRGCHVFIEKPLSHEAAGLRQLCEEVRRRRLVSIVGCNMRFHPGPAQVKRLLEQGAIGRVLFARVVAGSYLPAWRPAQDYRQSYSANRRMGGGCLLDCIHEIDLTRWYLGEVRELFCVAERLSSLEIDVEDTVVLVCRHENGCLSEIHLDYVQRTYERGCQIAGEDGSLFWDFMAGQVRAFEARTGQWSGYGQPEGWEVNRMYLDEMTHFLDCVRQGAETVLPVDEAARVMALVFAARESAAAGRMVPVGDLPA
jgi:predicted dehydrogenase